MELAEFGTTPDTVAVVADACRRHRIQRKHKRDSTVQPHNRIYLRPPLLCIGMVCRVLNGCSSVDNLGFRGSAMEQWPDLDVVALVCESPASAAKIQAARDPVAWLLDLGEGIGVGSSSIS